jgi:hypothetical protein
MNTVSEPAPGVVDRCLNRRGDLCALHHFYVPSQNLVVHLKCPECYHKSSFRGLAKEMTRYWDKSLHASLDFLQGWSDDGGPVGRLPGMVNDGTLGGVFDQHSAL